ncbi:MAG: transglutaminase family protein [Moraxellaceae bacterium]|nr:transglutaminase family protein [Moraxellaceae bacterium]
MPRYHVLHDTIYHYGAPVSLAQHLLHLVPRETEQQHVLHHELSIQPEPTERRIRQNWFGTEEIHITVSEPHDTLRVLAASTVDLQGRPAAHREAAGPAWEEVVASLARYPGDAPLDAVECTQASPLVPTAESLRAWANPSFKAGRPLLEAARELNSRLFEEFTFDPKATTVGTSVLQVLQQKRGVCQDFTHLMLGALRSLGLAARYMSGYLLTSPPPGKPRLIGADASHAWIALWCPGHGWVEFDPTNDCQPQDEHIVLGWGRDFTDVTPMRGVILGGADHEVTVEVTVMPAELHSLDSLIEEVSNRQDASEPEAA